MKKKVLALLVSASMAAGMAAYLAEGMKVNAAAYPPEEPAVSTAGDLEDIPVQLAESTKDWKWSEREDGTVSIESYQGNATQVEVPSMLDGREVTEISWYAFGENEDITSVTIPNTVKEIQAGAFENCSSLSQITLPEGLASLEDNIFYFCISLNSIDLPASLEKIGEGAFYGSGLQEIEIPDQVRSIGGNAFSYCNGLESVRLSKSLQEIGEEAFLTCKNLRSIEIPDQVRSIRRSTFSDCEGLEAVKLSDSLEEIGEGAFCNCENLQEIEFPGKMKVIEGMAFKDCANLRNAVFPAGVEVIGESAFDRCKKLKKIEILERLTSIGGNAFHACEELESVRLSDSLKEIGESAFDYCKNLKSVEIPHLERIGNYAFSYCESLRKLVLPEGVMVIGDSAFCNCYLLEEINFPNSLTYIGNRAFEECSYLTDEDEMVGLASVSIPENVNFIGSAAFLSCYALERIDVAEGNTAFCSVDGVLFNKEKTELLRFPEGKLWGNYEIPLSVQKIGDYALSNIRMKEEAEAIVKVPESVQEIGAYAFYNHYIDAVILPKGLRKIGDFAFADSLQMEAKEVEVPAGVTHIGEGVFSDNPYLIAINVDADNASFCSQNGVLFNKAKTELVAYPDGAIREKYSVPPGVARILSNAFSRNWNLKEVLIPKSVTRIEQYAFQAPELTDVTILNPQCVIGKEPGEGESDIDNVFPYKVTLHGYENSTAQAYAQNYGLPFEVITGEICEHEYKGIVTTPPACVQKGIKSFTCSKCGDSYTEELPVIGHDYQTVTVKATTGKDGSVQKKCKLCGDVPEAVLIAYPKTITLSKPSVTYNGKAQKVPVKVKDSAGRAVAAANYSVSYSGNKNVGEATVTINFKGNYTGSVKRTFRILPKGTSLSKVSAKPKGFLAKWKKQAAQTNGYQIQYSANSKWKGKDVKTVSVKKNGTTSKSISKLKAKKKYYVRIRTYKTVKIKGKNVTLYSGWSKAKAIKTK